MREPTSAGEPPHWSTVFAVADTDETVAKAKELGGRVLVEPLDLPDIAGSPCSKIRPGPSFR